jgi:alpha-beta hydrolase superfamily lysophospholipase
LVDDGVAVLDELMRREATTGLHADDVLLHGHSMGGAVALAVRLKRGGARAPIVNDRSFSSLASAAYYIFARPEMVRMRSIVAWLAGGLAGFMLSVAFDASLSLCALVVVAGGALMSAVARRRLMTPDPLLLFARLMLAALGWHVDSAHMWRQLEQQAPRARRLVVSHRADAIVRQPASLGAAIDNKSSVLELIAPNEAAPPSPMWHGMLLSDLPQWGTISSRISNLFDAI